MESKVDEIRQRRAGITPGQWHQRDPNVKSGDNIIIDSDSGQKGSAGQPLLSAVAQVLNFANFMSFDEGHKQCDAAMRRDADFIANAPTDIDFLLGELDRLNKEFANCRQVQKRGEHSSVTCACITPELRARLKGEDVEAAAPHACP